MWSKSLKIIMIESAIFGFCTGAFEILFSLYLNDSQFSLSAMGIMFSISGVLTFFITVVLGIESDVWGRKVVYSASLLLGSVTSFFVPMLRSFWELTTTRITEDTLLKQRNSVHTTFVFEHVRLGYAKLIAMVQGLELTLNGIGFLLAGSLLLYLGYKGSFIVLCVLFIVAFFVFQIVKEPSRPKGGRKSIREMYRFDLSKQLKILSAFNLIQGVGLAICHSTFIFTLFFVKKFAVEPLTLSLILGLHHFTFGLPMLIMSKLFSKPGLNLKRVFMFGTLLFGLSHIATALIPSLFLATSIWYIHDIFGASLFSPAQRAITQGYSRDESRGKDVNMTTAFNSIGLSIGPVIGGYLAETNINLPFFIGGLIAALSTLIIIPLKPMAK